MVGIRSTCRSHRSSRSVNRKSAAVGTQNPMKTFWYSAPTVSKRKKKEKRKTKEFNTVPDGVGGLTESKSSNILTIRHKEDRGSRRVIGVSRSTLYAHEGKRDKERERERRDGRDRTGRYGDQGLMTERQRLRQPKTRSFSFMSNA